MPAFLVPSLYLAALILSSLAIVKVAFPTALPSRRNIALASAVLVVECVALALGTLIDRHFDNQAMPWTGKVFSLLCLATFGSLVLRRNELRSAGFCMPRRQSEIRSASVFIALLAMTLSVTILSPAHQEFAFGSFLFMALVSGVDEELVFRGLMPFLLTNPDATGRPRQENRFLMLVVPTTAFALMHAWRYENGHFSFSVGTFAFAAIGSCGFMYIRRQSASLIHGVVAHNLINAATFVVLCVK